MTTNEQRATWGDDGFATQDGWAIAHCTTPETGEYQTTTDVWVSLGTGMPAGAYGDAPPANEQGKAIVRTCDGWVLMTDHRGETAYHKQTKAPEVITEFGELPETLTLLSPQSQFDEWNEPAQAWVKDAAAEQAWQLQQMELQRNTLMAEANQHIAILADAVDLGIATEDEQASYLAWRQYRVLLNRLDLTKQSVEWPPTPT